MKREVVQDFLNLPGIAGVALMDGRSRPYFCGVDQTLNTQQKEALAQGIRQVVETTPDGFESFEFQFTGHQVYIYKLDRGMILLVLTRSNLVYSDYLQAIAKLTAALREDITNAIATFRLLASNITLSNQSYWKKHSDASPTTSSEAPHSQAPGVPIGSQAPPSARDANLTSTFSNGFKNNITPVSVPSASAHQLGAEPSPDIPVNLKELLGALNQLSQFTTQYLGTAVISNYWKTSRPSAEWLNHFQVDRAAQISFSGPSPQATSSSVSSQQHEWIQAWVAAFIERCARVIRDFPEIVEQKGLNEQQKKLLLH